MKMLLWVICPLRDTDSKLNEGEDLFCEGMFNHENLKRAFRVYDFQKC